jgi:hypothetical protein
MRDFLHIRDRILWSRGIELVLLIKPSSGPRSTLVERFDMMVTDITLYVLFRTAVPEEGLSIVLSDKRMGPG